jgi:hypothetical protein
MDTRLPGAAFSSPAALRNRDPILAVLRRTLPATGLVLHVAEGSGEHVVHFAAALPDLVFQPTDPDPDARGSIEAWRLAAGLDNVLPALDLDASRPDAWPVRRAAAIVAINMTHISPWAATVGLIEGAGRILPPDGVLVLYGPWREEDVPTVPSNVAFDAALRARNPAWGLRDLGEVTALADASGLERIERVEMPANNLTVVFRRR